MGEAPGVLSIEEGALLEFLGVGFAGVSNVASERSGFGWSSGSIRDIAEQESGKAESARCGKGLIGSWAGTEVDVACAVGVRRNAEVARVAQICADLEGVVAANDGPIVDDLSLVFAFGQRAVAAVDVEALPILREECAAGYR